MAEKKDRGGQPQRLADMLGQFMRTSTIGDRIKQTVGKHVEAAPSMRNVKT